MWNFTVQRNDNVNYTNKVDTQLFLINKIQAKVNLTVSDSNSNITIELINVTHSTLQCSMICLHTPEGYVLYSNDFKFDNSPFLGEKPNNKRLEEIGKSGKLRALIVESLYSTKEMNALLFGSYSTVLTSPTIPKLFLLKSMIRYLRL